MKNGFCIASLILGILALLSICTAVLPIPLGAGAILFAVLGHRKGKQLDMMSLSGILTGAAGMAMSIAFIAMTFMMLPSMLKDEAYREQLNTMSESMYGITFDEMLEEGYGIDLDELLGVEAGSTTE